MTTLQEWGALAFGVVIGWVTYGALRKRSGPAGLGDISAVVGAVGGSAVLGLFPSGSKMFAAYGIGLAVGFFGYLAILLVLVNRLARQASDARAEPDRQARRG